MAFGLAVWLAAAAVCTADLPDVTGTTPASGSALALWTIHGLGYKNYKKAATDALNNLTGNADLRAELKSQAGLSTHLSELTLDRIAAIESRCDLGIAYLQDDYKGYFQMSEDACTDVNVAFVDISSTNQWRKGCEAGRLYLDKNWDRLVAKGATLTDGEKATLTLLYLTHQQGPAGGPALFADLNDGSAMTTPASHAMRVNVGPVALTAIEGGGHKMNEVEYYANWVGAIDAIMEVMTAPPQ